MMQTLAIFRDAYRELNHKKLFWVVMAISALVVGAFGAVGINDKGLSILWWQIDSLINTQLVSREMFFKNLFTSLGVGFWLTWGATILAIISVSSMIPDFIAGGSIDLTLSRPIGRVRLFLTKYAAGLLFVGLQVSLFTVAAFFVIGVRAGSWIPGLFWCIPLTLLFFSYLWSVCALAGLLTRSTIASLLITMLVWLGLFGLHTTESIFLSMRIQNQMRLTQLDEDLAAATQGGRSTERLERRKAEITRTSRWVGMTHGSLYAVKTVLPKTKETMGLLERVLVSQADLESLNDRADPPPMPFGQSDIRIDTREFAKRVKEEERGRPIWWIVGTSLGFEFILVGAACWVFSRRDF